jgi:nucleoside-diphosphate-sugar epimerase
MNRAIVTGANGFIGRHLVAALGERGWQVDALGRGASLAEPAQAVFHLAGLAHAGSQGAGRDEMFAVNVAATERLYREAQAVGVARFVWLSSIKVLGDHSAEALPVDAAYNPGDVYAESKVAAEQQLLASQANATGLCIVRPPLVYGAGVQANFLALMRAALSGWPLPLRCASAPRAWVGVHNLVDLMILLAQKEELPAQRIWHVRDEEQSSVAQMVRLLAARAGRRSHLWPLNPKLARLGGQLLRQTAAVSRLFEPLCVDMSQTAQTLQWRPPWTQEREIDEVVKWFLTR